MYLSHPEKWFNWQHTPRLWHWFCKSWRLHLIPSLGCSYKLLSLELIYNYADQSYFQFYCKATDIHSAQLPPTSSSCSTIIMWGEKKFHISTSHLIQSTHIQKKFFCIAVINVMFKDQWNLVIHAKGAIKIQSIYTFCRSIL